MAGALPGVWVFGVKRADAGDDGARQQMRQQLDGGLRTGHRQQIAVAVVGGSGRFQAIVVFRQAEPAIGRHFGHRPAVRVDPGRQVEPVGERNIVSGCGFAQASAMLKHAGFQS